MIGSMLKKLTGYTVMSESSRNSSSRTRRNALRHTNRLGLETLEGRLAPSTFGMDTPVFVGNGVRDLVISLPTNEDTTTTVDPTLTSVPEPTDENTITVNPVDINATPTLTGENITLIA